jgi:hypothetical protein
MAVITHAAIAAFIKCTFMNHSHCLIRQVLLPQAATINCIAWGGGSKGLGQTSFFDTNVENGGREGKEGRTGSNRVFWGRKSLLPR